MAEQDQPPLLIRDLPYSERPQTRLEQHGPNTLTTAELLAVLIGSGSLKTDGLIVAYQLLQSFGGLRELSRASQVELQQVQGIGQVRAGRLQAALELSRRLNQAMDEVPIRIHSPADAASLVMPELCHLEQEELRTILLNTRNEVLHIQTVYKGSLNSAVVRVGELFKSAIRYNAAALIVCHNHPSGDPSPSAEDVRMTRSLIEAGKLLDIDVLDHIIVGHNRFVSLKERDLAF